MKKFSKRRVAFIAVAIAMVAALGTSTFILRSTPTHAAPADNTQNLQTLTETGTSVFVSGASGLTGDTLHQTVPTDDDQDQHTNAKYDQAPTVNPNPSGSPVTTSNHGTTGFQGLDHFDTRTRDGGNAFSLEPPDQGLCTNGSRVLETVNDVLVVFDTHGNRLTTAESMNTFFNLPFSINRTTGVRGPFLSDPKCYYDAGTNRWFLSMLEEDAAPSVRAHTLLAVSQTSDPAGAWTDFSIDATDDGLNGTPSNAGCPCFGDQPLLGADAYGIYLSTNEFSDTGFNGAQVYAISKQGLVAAAHAGSSTLPPVVHINAGLIPTPDAGGIWYSIQPATTPSTSLLELGHNGTEYFLSALQFGINSPLDNRIATWALTNTHSLSNSHPNVTLLHTVIHSETYGGTQFAASQKVGPTPLGDLLTATTGDANPENQLNANDDRMNQVVFASGLLYSGLNTAVNADGSRTGIAYFIVFPYVYDNHSGPQVGAIMANQGYVSAASNNVFFPSIGVNRWGEGVMTFTLSGPNYYPSSAYVTLNVVRGAGPIHVAGTGVGPADGFTGYPDEGGNGVERWGDYSAAVAAPDGTIWFASEYIAQTCTDAQFAADATCGGTRTQLANWSTFIGHVTDADDR